MIDYPQWYWIPQVKFQIRKYTYRRETAFIAINQANTAISKYSKTTRMIKIHNVQHLDLWLKNMHISDSKKNFNLYYSVARYRQGIPNGSLNLADRDFGDWKDNYWKEMDSYDFFLDIDAGNHKEMGFAHHSAKLIMELFDKFNVPYHLRFSGMGFHFIIPYLYFSTHHFGDILSFNPDKENNIYRFFMKIAQELYDNYSEMIDTGIYDSRRVVKIPYSIALFPHKNYVCFPFISKDEFDNFNLDYAMPYNYMQNLPDEPEHLFNPNGNVFKLLKEFKLMKDG